MMPRKMSLITLKFYGVSKHKAFYFSEQHQDTRIIISVEMYGIITRFEILHNMFLFNEKYLSVILKCAGGLELKKSIRYDISSF